MKFELFMPAPFQLNEQRERLLSEYIIEVSYHRTKVAEKRLPGR
jgi:hypothetical protein